MASWKNAVPQMNDCLLWQDVSKHPISKSGVASFILPNVKDEPRRELA